MQGKTIEVEGPSVEDATELGLAALGLAAEDAVVEVLSAAPARPVRVRVSDRTWTSDPVPQETFTSAPADGSPTFPRKQVVIETLEFVIAQLGIEPQVSPDPEPVDGTFTIRVIGDGAAMLIGRHGQTVEALEYLLNRIAGGLRDGAPRIAVDIEGYRERREAALEELARSTAEQVRSSGRPVVLQPMSPRDRRIVHVVLQEDIAVETHSEGDGPFRTLIVSPRRA